MTITIGLKNPAWDVVIQVVAVEVYLFHELVYFGVAVSGFVDSADAADVEVLNGYKGNGLGSEGFGERELYHFVLLRAGCVLS